MLAILFPHMYEDVEYLLPPEGSVMESADSPKMRVRRGAVVVNAVAGPSRLPYNSSYN